MPLKGYNSSGVPDPKKHPTLIRLLADKTVYIQDGEYLGRAADGIVVAIGTVCFEDTAEKYLAMYPNPKDW